MTKPTTIISQYVADLQEKLVLEQKLLLDSMMRHTDTKNKRDVISDIQFQSKILSYEIQMVIHTNNIKAIERTIATIQTF